MLIAPAERGTDGVGRADQGEHELGPEARTVAVKEQSAGRRRPGERLGVPGRRVERGGG
ncbi:hypothetical protein SGFS_040340 [Streptomyces graminofaciens]|uniref:Uncharacterized protein n=1 Tax=Streptomyces graminofaciens TaxID=68212 RepID=A0ABN5VH86_9ACTN|nr:hypothetical protein SGFS_040340 [Streptomyces graminofaciens]